MIITKIFHPLRSLTNEELMGRVAAKADERAYDELYNRNIRRLVGFIYRQTGRNEQLAADLAQDTFLRIWSSREEFRPGADFAPWMFTIACNLCRNTFRHNGHEADYELHIAQTTDEATEPHIDQMLDGEAFDNALRKLLSTMTPDMRLLFSLRFEEELTVPQIAQAMTLAEGTVKSRLHTLTQTLKQKLTQYENI